MIKESEKQLKRKCRKWLKSLSNSKWVSYNPYPTGEPGTPDMIGSINGRSVLIECKVVGKNPTPIQKVRIREWRQSGSLVFIVHTIDELKTFFKENNLIGGQ